MKKEIQISPIENGWLVAVIEKPTQSQFIQPNQAPKAKVHYCSSWVKVCSYLSDLN